MEDDYESFHSGDECSTTEDYSSEIEEVVPHFIFWRFQLLSVELIYCILDVMFEDELAIFACTCKMIRDMCHTRLETVRSHINNFAMLPDLFCCNRRWSRAGVLAFFISPAGDSFGEKLEIYISGGRPKLFRMIGHQFTNYLLAREVPKFKIFLRRTSGVITDVDFIRGSVLIDAFLRNMVRIDTTHCFSQMSILYDFPAWTLRWASWKDDVEVIICNIYHVSCNYDCNSLLK